jgi:rRNA maturation endonuclease Nob1
MAGGMLGDALEESGVSELLKPDSQPLVMIRCRGCQKLNEEDSKFCQECGEPI